MDNDAPSNKPAQARFEPTRWSVVLASAQTQAPGARHALSELCRTYWQPLYAFARRHGLDHHHAQDTIQSFFLALIENKTLSHADPLKGRFRNYLLACLRNHMASATNRDHAQKRGGGNQPVSIDDEEVREKFETSQPAETIPAEAAFEREWAVATVEAALAQLEKYFARKGKLAVFKVLKPFLIDEPSPGAYDEAATALDQSPGALRTGIHRLRHDFRTHLRREVAKTVDFPDQIDEEMRHLRAVLAGETS